jgi:hypothetical protein
VEKGIEILQNIVDAGHDIDVATARIIMDRFSANAVELEAVSSYCRSLGIVLSELGGDSSEE